MHTREIEIYVNKSYYINFNMILGWLVLIHYYNGKRSGKLQQCGWCWKTLEYTMEYTCAAGLAELGNSVSLTVSS